MTEAEWLSGDHPAPMISFLKSVSHRRYRLFVCACCNRVLGGLNRICHQSLAVAEAFADGKVTEQNLEIARRIAFDSARNRRQRDSRRLAMSALAVACESNINRVLHAIGVVARSTGGDDPSQLARAFYELVPVLHDIFGNPFHPIAINPSWLSSTVLSLAKGIYEEKAFDRLPILADALQDAGCENEDILKHCSQTGGHFRGCWVVDLLLGKA